MFKIKTHASRLQKVSKPFSVIINMLVIKILTKSINKCILILETFSHKQMIKQKLNWYPIQLKDNMH